MKAGRPPNDARIAQVCQLADEGMTAWAIHKQLGIPRSTVTQIVERHKYGFELSKKELQEAKAREKQIEPAPFYKLVDF